MMKVNPENFDKMQALSTSIRGRIIDGAITIETLISIFLTGFFSQPDKKELFERYLMSDVLTFEQKSIILSSLVKNGYVDECEPYETVGQDLQWLRNIRNLLAHSILLTDTERVNNFDGTILYYVSYTLKKEKLISVYIDTVEESEKNHIYSANNTVHRVNRLYDWLVEQNERHTNNSYKANASDSVNLKQNASNEQ